MTKKQDPLPTIDTRYDDLLEQVEMLLIQGILHNMRPQEIKMKFDHIRAGTTTDE